jgi:putative methionine-R-sulfoxide reductase with GAF domain
VITPSGALRAVFDVDSDDRAAFSEVDRVELEAICAELGARFDGTAQR